MSEKRLSHCQGKGSLTHNNRKFNAKNVDDAWTKNNIVFMLQPIEKAYERLFGTAVERYNAKQKRTDRKIKTSCFQHIFKRDIPQSVVTAAERRESELNAEITKLKKENEEAAARNTDLEQKVRSLLPLKDALDKAENELNSLKSKYKKVLEFIDSLKLTQKLQEFLKTFTKRYQM